MNKAKLLEIFGLDRNFKKVELEQSYRDLVQVWHPDRYSYNPRLQRKAEEKLKEINGAYEVLREMVSGSHARSQSYETSSHHAETPTHRESRHEHLDQDETAIFGLGKKRPTRVFLRSIFHPTDFSGASDVAFCHALKLAVNSGAGLSILHVAANREEVHFLEFPEVRHTLERWSILPQGSRREDVAEKAGIHVEKIVQVHEGTVHSILHFLEHSPTDLIVLATHPSKDPTGWLKKSMAMPIALGSGEMTLFIPEGVDGFVSVKDGTVSLKRVLIPIDNHPNPQLAVNAASTLVRALGCEDCQFLIVHIGDSGHMPAVNIPVKEGWHWEKKVRDGDVVEEILRLRSEYSSDLIVMTTHGHEGFLDAFRGSTTETVLHGARCPLLAIPALKRHR